MQYSKVVSASSDLIIMTDAFFKRTFAPKKGFFFFLKTRVMTALNTEWVIESTYLFRSVPQNTNNYIPIGNCILRNGTEQKYNILEEQYKVIIYYFHVADIIIIAMQHTKYDLLKNPQCSLAAIEVFAMNIQCFD